MNYRNKIVSDLKIYSVTVIRAAYPEYYPQVRPLIEEISSRIIGYREKKGTNLIDDIIENYYADTLQLRDISKKITTLYSTLDHLKGLEWKEWIKNNKLSWIIGIAGIIIAVLAFIL
jgi:hypothetical protein